ncbi:MAG TPA: DUF2934 domain-containing protein [Geminicoccaceae bacterium]|nr:DUF2934 domain-containing protein [Geminicoccus sp.]HMU50285.1 DUF2934 domain-containing protein [Geminicoccaceae bacterium]
MTPADLEAGIRTQAYQLWEAAGRPEGCDLEHWLQAEAIVSGTPLAEAPATKPKRARKAETAAEPKPATKVKAKAAA